ncbi:hypothetical protein HAZT_HAZT001753 [Hyalella azteca]|uniref:Mos1 transposase HTH domain-containing protein n=1 Tax=Hyalella azteca TaxID=294128 RepID=A0A6A0GV20_HYAAZ|nr:hypothetical protein HAZT_HAZT001753 [Hyalella azteca]
MERSLEQRYAIKFCVRLERNATETFQMLQEAFKDDCISKSQSGKWHKAFKEGREEVADEPRSGRPTTTRTEENVDPAKVAPGLWRTLGRWTEKVRGAITCRWKARLCAALPGHVSAGGVLGHRDRPGNRRAKPVDIWFKIGRLGRDIITWRGRVVEE